MIDCKCCFSITLITEDFSCEHAQLVTRRAGPDIACQSEQGSNDCKHVYEKLKSVGLPAFDAEDDLLETPASVFTKIQFGGLLSLQKYVTESEHQSESVENIYQLIQQVMLKEQVEKSLNYQDAVDDITAFKLKRHKNRKKLK